MGCYPIGSECCNNCVHWQCHAERKLRGNPPKEVYTDSNLDKCSLTGRDTLSKSTCGMFKHIGGIRKTFAAQEKHAGNDPILSMIDSCDESTRALVQATIEYSRETNAIRQAAAATHAHSTCPTCHGSGREECFWCHGKGKTFCSTCDGKGGFVKTLEICEHSTTCPASTYLLPDSNVDLKFYGCSDRVSDRDSVDDYEEQVVICQKQVRRNCDDTPAHRVSDAIELDGDDFDFPSDVSRLLQGEIREKVDSLYPKVDAKIKDWKDDGGECRIKEAAVSVKQTPCIVRVRFVDAHGFPCEALVNLANRKVHVYDVEAEVAKPALEKLARRAGSGDAEMQNVLGQIYAQYPKFKHIAVEKDAELAAAWFLRAAKGGCADAMDNLGNCLKDGDGVEKDVELSFAWYLKAAKKGLAWGQFHAAKGFFNGTGVEKDLELARHWYFKAAKQGLADAQNMAGRCAEEGWGMEKDPEMAFSWYLQAAKNGHATAMHNLSLCYGSGIGCEKDAAKKEEWRKKAREYGYVEKNTSGW